jgi:hypothetical protein
MRNREMQRRYLSIGGVVLALLAVTLVVVLVPGLMGGPGTSGPGGSTGQSSVKAEPRDTTVLLTWAPIEGAAGYLVYRDGSKEPLNPTPVTETKYEDIGLTNGRTYTYQVATVDAAGIPNRPSTPVKVSPKSK